MAGCKCHAASLGRPERATERSCLGKTEPRVQPGAVEGGQLEGLSESGDRWSRVRATWQRAAFLTPDAPGFELVSAGEHDGGLAHIPGKVTGFGVRFTLSLVLDENIHETAA